MKTAATIVLSMLLALFLVLATEDWLGASGNKYGYSLFGVILHWDGEFYCGNNPYSVSLTSEGYFPWQWIVQCPPPPKFIGGEWLPIETENSNQTP